MFSTLGARWAQGAGIGESWRSRSDQHVPDSLFCARLPSHRVEFCL